VNQFALTVYTPDGASLDGFTCYGGTPSCAEAFVHLPQTGTYRVVASPGGFATLSFTATVSEDVSGTLVIGTPLNVNLPAIGQAAYLTFNVTPETGQTLALNVAGITTNPANTAYGVWLFNFDQNQQQVGNAAPQTSTIFNLPNLAVGTYSILITPAAPVTGSMQVTLEPGVTPALSLTGVGSNVSTPAPGQGAYMTFSGIAGQSVSLGVTNLVLTPNTVSFVIVNVLSPDGTSISSTSCVPTACEFSLMNLPKTGTYTVTVLPNGAATMTFTATMSVDVGGHMTLGTGLPVNLAALGQSALLNFTATAGENVTLTVSGITTVPASTYVYVYVYNAAGTQVGSANGLITATVNLSALPAGTYTVLITPTYPVTASMTATYN